MGKVAFLCLEMPNQQKKCMSVCPSDNSSKSEPIWMNLFLKGVGRSISGSKMSKIGPVDPEIWPKKWSK